jgi:hypothetical protein
MRKRLRLGPFAKASVQGPILSTPAALISLICVTGGVFFLRILVYWVIYDSGQVSLEHLLLSWYSSQANQP